MARRPMTEAQRQANAARVARWREQHIRSEDAEHERLTLVLKIGTKDRLQQMAERYGYRSVTQLIETWAEENCP